jgi:lipopolysaccharide transport system ATP-binding protein
MLRTVIKIENLSKVYHLDAINATTFKELINNKVSGLAIRRPERIRSVLALDNVSLDVYEGESLGIIGKNGSGKSTLLKILTGISSPTSGKVTIHGRVGSVLDIGLGFHPELSGRENILISGELLGMNRREIRRNMDEIIDFSGIGKFIDTAVKYYSSGMFVRLAFSVIAHLPVDILLFDEVLAVGDTQFQAKSFNRIQSLLQKGTTMLLVSHNLSEIQKACTRALLLEKGRIVSYGSTEEIILSYAETELAPVKEDHTETGVQKPQGRSAVVWENILKAPGNDLVRLRKVLLYARNKKISDEIFVTDDVMIEIEFWKLKEEDLVDVGFSLNHFGNIVFVASNILARRFTSRDKGLYRASTVIPCQLLNSTLYSIDVFAFRNRNEILLKQPDLVYFKVKDVVDEIIETVYEKLPSFPGSVRPALSWDVERLE